MIKIPIKCYCNKIFDSTKGYIKHKANEIKQIGFGRSNYLPNLSSDSKFKLSRQAFKSFLQQYELYPEELIQDAEQLFMIYRSDIEGLFQQIFTKLKSFKVQFCLQATFSRQVGEIITYTTSYFPTKNIILSPNDDLVEIAYEVIGNLDNQIQTFESLGSGWKIHEIDRLDIRVAFYKPLTGGCMNWKLSEQVFSKKAVLSVKSIDNKCFIWSILAHLAINKNKFNDKKKIHPYRLSVLKNYEKYIDPSDICFPTEIKSIKKFEKNNRHLDIRINVYSWEKIGMFQSSIVPIYSIPSLL